jgi:hypothetical protein
VSSPVIKECLRSARLDIAHLASTADELLESEDADG